MISKIAHLADVHIRKAPLRKEEYENVFKNLIDSLKIEKPDRIVIVGDLVHDYLDLQGEQLIMAHELLNALALIAPVRITRGNHDCRKKNLRRVDSIKAIVKTLDNPLVVYYDKTGIYNDDNILWAVWHHGEKNNNPWKRKGAKDAIDALKNSGEFIPIDLFHDPINNCKSTTGFEMKSKQYYKVSDFKGEFSLFGDIHRMQYLGKNQTKAYCGSLIAQDVYEGDDAFHGYLLWNISDKSVKEIPIANEWSFKNVKITPYTDFNDLDFEISNPTKYMRIRFIWGTLPQTRTKENERYLVEYIKSKYNNFTISHENKFLESENIEINENVTLENITETTVQHEIFNEYLERIGTDKQLINDVIALDEEISVDIVLDDISNIEWNIIKFGGKDFMSYHELDIDWRDMDGLFQITGINTAGKTTIMKLISYILFGKTLETETRMKYGDQRFVNNRNNATSCEGYLVLEANGEYYGIKKKTEITHDKTGEISGAPTTIDYYLLTNPDEAMNANTSLDKLDEDRRTKTQAKINTIIGNYDNFMRIVMTTSDTLNRILSNDMAVFIDSLLYDSGLDIFDKKLESLKIYQKKVNEKTRVVCDILKTEEQNKLLAEEIVTLENEIQIIETTKLPEVSNKIQFGRTYIENLSKKLFKIDPEIYSLSVDDTKKTIGIHNDTIAQYKQREEVLKANIAVLRESYDAERLKLLNEKKETHKTTEYQKRINIKSIQQNIRDEEHQIEIINGEIFNLKKTGAEYKQNIFDLRNSRICPTCGQKLTAEHQVHINDKIKEIEEKMFPLATQIRTKNDIDIPKHQKFIEVYTGNISTIKEEIESDALEMESVLQEIGTLTNEMNDVNKRNIFQNELNQIPTKIQNEELHITLLQQKINNYDNNLLQIEENHKIEKVIDAARERLEILEDEEEDSKENIYIKKTALGEKSAKITVNNELITAFKEQEYRDSVITLYKKCVHRDGIPRQILVNYILPKINVTLENILSVAPFKVWLDFNDLRPKLAYNNRPFAIIDCISASGKERTFASVVLKFALNQINVKAKPTMFLLDEVMGKLDLEGSVEEFIGILQLIKNYMKKTLVVEQVHEIASDFIIEVSLDEDGISSMILE